MKVLTVIGARPQFIKMATVSRAIRNRNRSVESPAERLEEIVVHTGQHFDANMSDVFFDQLDIPRPDHHLGIASLSHGGMTGRMLEKIEELILQERPDWVLVYGDTNSTLAGSLAAAKLHVPVIHVEAGLRSHNPNMPEEINRVLTDRISRALLCPTAAALTNLEREGFPFLSPGGEEQFIENIGDVMFDAVLYYKELARRKVSLDSWKLTSQGYVLCTLHRQENTDDPRRLQSILAGLREIARELPVILPVHPRTAAKLNELSDERLLAGLTLLEPVPYLEMQRLQMDASLILTDSGGMQKEAYFHGVPCITLRDETEWTETIEMGWNRLAGADRERIVAYFHSSTVPQGSGGIVEPYGDGTAANKVVDVLVR